MKNKGLYIILIFSILLLGSLIYINYFTSEMHFEGAQEEETIEVLSKYKGDTLNVCYGNKIRCVKTKYIIRGNVNTNKLGTYNITYVAKHKNKEYKFNKIVKVVDTTTPQLIVEGKFDHVCPNGNVSDVKLSATDNYDGDISNKIEYKLNGNKLIYKVVDSSNNETIKEFAATINDNEMPSLVLKGSSTMYLVVGSKYTEPGYTAVDICDGDLTKSVAVSGGVDTSKAGTNEISYVVKDGSGNTQIAKRKIVVFNKNNAQVGSVTGKVIYLTFDDGPGAHTARLLDILNKYNAKVTFFVAGQFPGYHYLIAREYNEGHTVGLHTYTHRYDQIYTSVDAFMNDLNRIQDVVVAQTGKKATLTRFPGGSDNTVSRKYSVGIMSILTTKLESEGYRYFDWTISSGDAGGTTSSDKIVQNVINSVGENKANVILMHDIKGYTVDSIERILQWGLANGYTFAPLTMDSPVVHSRVNN